MSLSLAAGHFGPPISGPPAFAAFSAVVGLVSGSSSRAVLDGCGPTVANSGVKTRSSNFGVREFCFDFTVASLQYPQERPDHCSK